MTTVVRRGVPDLPSGAAHASAWAGHAKGPLGAALGTRIAVGVVLSRRRSRPPNMAWDAATVPPQAHSKGRHFLRACASRKLWRLHGASASRPPGLPPAACLRSTTATRTPAARALEPKRRWGAADALTLSAVQKSWLRTYHLTHASADACRTGAQRASAQCDTGQAASIAVRRHSPAPVCPGAGKPVRRQGRHTKRWGWLRRGGLERMAPPAKVAAGRH